MGIFDPVVDTEVNPPSAVATPAMPSAAGGFGQIFGGLVGAIGQAQRVAGSGGPSSTELRQEEERLRTVGLTDALMENQALWEENPSQARIRENQILLNYTRDGGDPSGEAFQNTYRLATGRDPDQIGMSHTQVMIEAVQATPEYSSAYIASFSTLDGDVSEEDRQAYALSRVATMRAHELILQDNSVSWNEREAAISSIVTGFMDEGLGVLMQGGQSISEEDFTVMRAQFEIFRGDITRMRPEGISDTQWSSIEAQLTGIDNALQILERTSGLQGLELRTRDQLVRIIQNTPMAPGERLAIITALGDVATAMNLGVYSPTEMETLLSSVVTAADPGADGINPDMTAGSLLNDPISNPNGEVFPQAVVDGISQDLEPEELFSQAREGLRFVGSQPASSYGDETQRDSLGQIIMRNFAALNQAGNVGGFASANGVNRTFGGTTLTAIDRIAQYDPEAARMLYLQGATAIRTQGAAAHATFQTMLARNPDVIHENGQIIITEDWLINNAGMSPEAAAAGQRAADDQGISLLDWARQRSSNASFSGRAWDQLETLQHQGDIVMMYSELDGVYSNRLGDAEGAAQTLADNEGLLGTMTAGGTYRPIHSPQEMRLAIGADATNLHPAFADGLTGLLNAARAEGIQVTINNSYRSPETQAALIADYWGNYNLNPADRAQWLADVEEYGAIAAGQMWESTFTNATRLSDGSPMRNWIALPGRSNHQHGLAADLAYGSQTDIDWVHANAARFGLHFPLGNENWHVEVMGSRDGTVGRHSHGGSEPMDPQLERQFQQILREQPQQLREAFDGLLRGSGSVPADEAVAFNEAQGLPASVADVLSERRSEDEVGQLAEATADAQARDEEERGVAAQQEAQALTASEVLDDNMMRQLRQLGGSELTPAYTSIDEAADAIRRGELRSGMAFVLNGQIRVYEEPNG